ncbi:MAG: BTAD domain-containing putative transcriptional regulator [Desulfobacterales bacterium]|nr:BTAD domain-containing putative transcriptional regulator [Desulfobacterales bacterium]
MERRPMSLAKISKPRLQRVLPRYRLFSLLDENRSFPAIWVSGPGGAGKTTLLASYLDHHQMPYLWYQIDEGDSDVATFFYYMQMAGQKIAPRLTSELPTLAPEYMGNISAFTKRFFEELLDRLKKPGVMVIDNYQDAYASSRLHEILRDALAVIPEQINLFILSRTDPPASLSRAQAGNILYKIDWPELRFQPDETRNLISSLNHHPCSEKSFEYLYRKTEGWVAGLLLLLKHTDFQSIDETVFTQINEDVVFDYFASEILREADPEMQHFLRITSVLPLMTEQMAAELTGNSHAYQLLQKMVKNHWFTSRFTDRKPIYQYHPMFREFLLNHALDVFPGPRMTRLKSEAARLLAAEGFTEPAVSLFFESGDVQDAIRLILKQAREMMLHSRFQTLEEWLRRLPEDIVATHPRVLYWLGACRLYIDPAEGIEFFEKAMTHFEARADKVGAIFCICGVIDSIVFRFGTFKPLDRWITKLTGYSKGFRSLPSEEVKARMTFSMLHALSFRQPTHPGIKTWENRGLEILQHKRPAEIKIRLILPFILIRIFTGNLSEAEYFITTHRDTLKTPNLPPLALIAFKKLEAFYCWMSADFETCRNVVERGRILAAATGIQITSAFLSIHGAAGALSSGDLGKAREHLQTATKYVSMESAAVSELFHTISVWQALLEGDAAKASLHAELALDHAANTGMPFSAAASHLGYALALHASKKATEADRALKKAILIARRSNTRPIEFAAYLAQAEFALDHGDGARARHFLKTAMAIGNSHQFLNTWFWRPDQMVRLCCKALEADIEVSYVQKLIRCRKLTPDAAPLAIENWPWPLKIYTLGRFTIIKDGKQLTFSKKTQERPLTLLKTIISMGGREVSINGIADFLWPEADGDAAHGAFKTTLHRLRKLLGFHEAILATTGTLTLDPKYCWVDAWVFERTLSEADAVWQSGEKDKDSAQAVELTRKALNLYKGMLFQSEDNQVFFLREHLHNRYLKAVNRLAAYWQSCGAYEKAVELYGAGLKVDELAESFYQGLMVCNYRLGREARALAAYNQCRKVLAAVYNLSPCQETEALAKELSLSPKNQ